MKFDEYSTTIGELLDDPDARKILIDTAPIIDGLPIEDFYRDITYDKASGFIRRYLGQEAYNRLLDKLRNLN